MRATSTTILMKTVQTAVSACLALVLATGGHAAEYAISGFGSLGGAITDESTIYQRYMDDSGTLMRDSLLGVQLDAKFNDQWGAAAQVLIAPRTDEDTGVDPQCKWTFLSYRPANDWLFRLGRLSLGGLLNQQNMDVGVSYDLARLPNEVYLLSSAYDFDGMSIARTWNANAYEITLEGSFGVQDRDFRGYKNGSEAAIYYSTEVTGGGLVATISDFDRTMVRIGWHLTEIDPDNANGFLSKYNFVPLGDGRYTLGAPDYTSRVRVNTFFLGARVPLGEFLVSGECTAVRPADVDPAPPNISAYISVARKLGNWTPYLTHARIWTSEMDTWRRVRGASPVPLFGVTEVDIDDGASTMAIFEQNSSMLGFTYTFTPKQKLKAEVMRTHIGERSAMFDGNLAHEDVMVYSLSYSFAF